MASTAMAGRFQSRSTIGPLPISRTPSRHPPPPAAGPRVVQVGGRTPGQSSHGDVALVVVQRRRCSRDSAVRASGTTPPHMPEWTAWSSVRTSTSQSASSAQRVVSAGVPMSQFPESAITMTSLASRSRYRRRIAGSDCDPDSSSPSMKTVTPTGRSAPCARMAARWAAMPALSSAAPRPNSRPPRSVGSNGSVSHASMAPSGCTSWWAYSSTVGWPAGAGRRAITAGSPPGISTTRVSKPSASKSAAVAAADRRTSS